MKQTAIARALAVLAGVLAAASTGAAEPLRPGDFATGRPIETPGDDPLQTLLLDPLVYQGSVGRALSDLRVFNAEGEQVPHAIRTLHEPGEASAEPVAVPVFRLPSRAAGRRGEGEDAPLRLSSTYGVEVEVSDEGAIVRVDPIASAPAAPGATADPAAVLIDLSALERTTVGLSFDLGAEPREFLTPLRIEVSDDLVRFRSVPARAALARLDQGGHRIERSDVTFGAVKARYALVSAAGRPLPVEILAARAHPAPTRAAPPRHETKVAGARIADEPGAFLFDLGGALPVDRAQVALPERNTVVRATLFSSDAPDGRWTHVRETLLYRIDRETPLRNAALSVPTRRHRYYKLVVSPQGGGLGGGVPTLEASWHPEQLLFVQRGPAPFSLGYGRADTRPVRFDAAELLRTVGAPRDTVPRETARLGPPRPVGDPSVLEPVEPGVAPRTVALWAFLILVVAGVLALSLRLLGQMRSGEDEPTSGA